ncbi:MAG: thioredoxin family protein [Novosphingobium sp.]
MSFRPVCILLHLLSLLCLAIAAPAVAQDDRGPHVAITLVSESDRPAPGGEVMLAFASSPQPGWHAYWLNPGDTGIPTEAKWSLPSGVEAGPLRFPVPGRLLISGLMNYVYEKPFAQLVTLKLASTVEPGERLPIAVKLDYLVCTTSICVPESASLSTVLTAGDGSVAGERRARFDRWRAALPRPLAETAVYQVEGDKLRLAVPYPAEADLGEAYFYPATDGVIDYGAAQTVARDGNRLVIATRARGAGNGLEGVLATGEGRGLALSAKPGTVAPAPSGMDGEDGSWWTSAALALAGAVLGGVLLNVMPCVFPILSLKALSLAKANTADGAPRREALAYTAGVVLVCLALGGALLAIRAAGASVGWAFQLQDPRVILLLLLLTSGIALNLAGLFEMTMPPLVDRLAGRGSGGAFATGALAAFVATPCTGPFMGAALGAALVLPWPAALAVFAGLGLGIALPFLLLGFVPALRRKLPRPGPWMATFRRILSLPMFVTALALAWVLGRQAGVDGMAIGLAAALLAAFGLWWVGRRQARGLPRQWLPALPLLALALAAGAAIRPAPAAAGAELAGTERFSEARLAELNAQGRPVFAYFTADWCLTCKVNEKAVIETAAVDMALRRGKVAVLVGDWTDGDPALGRFLERHDRAGVPLYLWYKPGETKPVVLPQILSRELLTGLAAGL